MYRHHYGLRAKPFQISTDPAFLWMGPKHRKALAVLNYGARSSGGVLLLSGGVGTGKTTLVRTVLAGLGKDVVVATVADPGLAPLEFFNTLAGAYGLRRRYAAKVDFLFDFERFLRRTRAARRIALLVVDEAQRLEQPLLEEIRLLSDIEDPDRKLLNVFLVGQETFLEKIATPPNRALKQRVTRNCHLEPLSLAETEAYVRHRLTAAGATRELFAPDALPGIHAFALGTPRLINILCDFALLTGYVRDADTIDAAIIAECVEDLMLPGENGGEGTFAEKRTAAAPPPAPGPPTAADRRRPAGSSAPRRRRRTLAAAAVLLLLTAGLGTWLRPENPRVAAPPETAAQASPPEVVAPPAAPIAAAGQGSATGLPRETPLIGHELPDAAPPEDSEAAGEETGAARTGGGVPAGEVPGAPESASARPDGRRATPAGTPPAARDDRTSGTAAPPPKPPAALTAHRGGAPPAPAQAVRTPTPEARPGRATIAPPPDSPGPEGDSPPAASRPRATAPAPPPATIEDRLRAFIEAYCRAYESRDLERFQRYFTEDAVELGRPFRAMLPTYARHFASLDALAYTIDLAAWREDGAAGTVTLRGRFTLRYRRENHAWSTARGTIEMTLAETGDGFRVRGLGYEKEVVK